ncbi:hypothetical protein C2W58_02667 [Bacillus pumilus]|uniref:Uncharacterized protein n=1 Tax=Bacillus pumilus TaxID=1408 RepID=A0AB34QU65_BACPU|nr:hypothetical protein B4127_4149 [Bacillus pumilus]RAP03911.1 hypothetical protein C2W58_02667 [Bacillus pumilus]
MTIVINVMDLGAFIICTLLFIALWFEESEEASASSLHA